MEADTTALEREEMQRWVINLLNRMLRMTSPCSARLAKKEDTLALEDERRREEEKRRRKKEGMRN